LERGLQQMCSVLVHADVQQRRQQVQQRPCAVGIEVEPAADHGGGRAATADRHHNGDVRAHDIDTVDRGGLTVAMRLTLC